jgi:hypothetical protein
MNQEITHFQMVPALYAARFEDSIIILDSTNDKYLSLIDEAASYFQLILEQHLVHQDGKYIASTTSTDVDQLNYWIDHFVENGFIIATQDKTQLKKILTPHKPGGLIEYRWDSKSSWRPFAQSSKITIIKAFFQLTWVTSSMKRKGIQEILKAIKNPKYQTNTHIPTQQEVNQLANAVDAASILYPKKTFCLAWAATFTLLALKKKWKCDLVIGVQTNPFYAHAWAECAGKVVNDDPAIAQVLSVICKEPYA